ncbi:phytase [Candidatus Uabimicrobium sp. HlEnr_7]|uniref:phytase n=1 Tax=Candidatus Uabimicrobium helgolandensis TaxID=3095367 RepID=UPI0035587FA5
MSNKKFLIPIVFSVIGLVILFYPRKPEIFKQRGLKFSRDAKYGNPQAKDQDDMCIWVHPLQPQKSLVITADKVANQLFVYTTTGKLLQSLEYSKPGNIDLRYNFSLNGEKIDIVTTTTRGTQNRILVFKIDRENFLQRIDDGSGEINQNRRYGRKSFGGTLFHNRQNNKFYFIKTDEDDNEKIEQFEILDNKKKQVTFKKVRDWDSPGKCEGAVADDERGVIYVCQEKAGIWAFSTDLEKPLQKKMIAPPTKNESVSLEGIALYKISDEEGYIIVSLQRHSSFCVFDRVTNRFITDFHIRKVTSTDGLDITPYSIHPQIEGGLFLCHTTPLPPNFSITATSWNKIAKKLKLKYKSTYKIRK